ncbi:PREDICTED: natural killer cell receptor 2B4 [Condylura cristata]|uniref:natural killer cell receptor 2B4 n=1 Tax=Condylura cristata TaxID=143302 RepID=UPI000643D791|nr:PREDICTED: natural killer cell receptor 2B4 [Condylura cristata]
MLGPALLLTIPLLLQAAQDKECPNSDTRIVLGLSGQPLWLRPNSTQTGNVSVKWTFKQKAEKNTYVILDWEHPAKKPLYGNWSLTHFNNQINFAQEDFTLHIKEGWPEDSGLYLLKLTLQNGDNENVCFQVFILEGPTLQGETKILDGGMCLVSLNCSISRDDDINMNFAWFRGEERIQEWGYQTYSEQVADDSVLLYSCSVNYSFSVAYSTLNLMGYCQSWSKWSGERVLIPSIAGSAMLLLFILVITVCFCVRKKKVNQSEDRQQQFLPTYEHVNTVKPRRDQAPAQRTPEDMNTIYSLIQPQSSSASTSQENEKTVYAQVQITQKKRNHSSSVNCTVYEEVGSRMPRAQNPARLSRRELENFRIYT